MLPRIRAGANRNRNRNRVTVAFLGLGHMGAAMAGRLVDAGEQLAVWNRTPAKAVPLVARGARETATPQAAIADADVVFSSLMDDGSVTALFDPAGPAFTAFQPGAVHVSLTTVSPECADGLQAAHERRGVAFVSGPVVGRPDTAAAGTLVQFLAGDPQGMKRIEPLCAKLARHIVHIPGSAGAANRQKLCVNFFVIAVIEAMAESLTLAERCGASRELVLGLFDQSFASPAFKGYARRLYDRDTSGDGGFSLRAGNKDLQLILSEARRAGCPLELGELIAEKMCVALARRMGDCDWSAIAEISRERAGLPA